MDTRLPRKYVAHMTTLFLNNPHEARLKVAVVSSFINQNVTFDDFLIINEFTSNLSGRRVDLAIVNNGTLFGFEIKSARDSTRRLQAQMAVYLRNFDRLTIVADQRHAKEVYQLAKDAKAGLWLATGEDISVQLKGRASPVKDPSSLLLLFPDRHRPRAPLSGADLRKLYFEYLSKKYSQNRAASREARVSGTISESQLASLSEYRTERQKTAAHFQAVINQWNSFSSGQEFYQSSQSSSASASAD